MDILNTKIKDILTEKTLKVRPENIKSGVNILGIDGSVIELKGEVKTVNPTTNQQTIIPTSTGKNALTQVTVNAVTNTIDNNIVEGNIKSGVSILGVQGSSKVLDTTDSNATAGDIVTGKTAFVNGQKITGNYTGIIPTGTKNITENSIVDVTNYASVNVNVPAPSPNLQSKSIEITENTTQTVSADSGYDGLNEVEITTNVSGGASTDIKKISEINQNLMSMVDYFNNYAKTVQNNYNVLTNDSVTLYTPNIDYKYYIIQKRSSGNYRVAWVNSSRKIDDINIYPFVVTITNVSKTGERLSRVSDYRINNSQYDTVYISSEYSSIETCIEKMKNNELTYSSIYNFMAYVPDTPSKIPISNVAIYYFNSDSSTGYYPTNDEFMMPTKISSNETFVQI